MGEVVLLKTVQEWRRDALDFALFDDHHTIEVTVHSARFDVSANGDVGIVTRPRRSVDTMETSIEEIVEALVNRVSLREDYSVALGDRVSDGSYSVHLRRGRG